MTHFNGLHATHAGVAGWFACGVGGDVREVRGWGLGCWTAERRWIESWKRWGEVGGGGGGVGGGDAG